MTTKHFPIEDILTITTGIMLSSGLGGAKTLTAFLFGDPDGAVFDLTLVNLQPEAARRLLAQHPTLPTERHVEGIGERNWREFLEEKQHLFGGSLPIELGEPLPDA